MMMKWSLDLAVGQQLALVFGGGDPVSFALVGFALEAFAVGGGFGGEVEDVGGAGEVKLGGFIFHLVRFG